MSNDPDQNSYDIEEEEQATGEGMPVAPGRDDANQPLDEDSDQD